MSYEKNDDDNGNGSDDGFICICKKYEWQAPLWQATRLHMLQASGL